MAAIRKQFYLFALALCSMNAVICYAQAPDLDALMKIAKSSYPQVDSLDRMSSQLHYFDSISPSLQQEEMLMIIYKAAANGYAVNLHYKQAYERFNKYLSLKEKKLTIGKATTIEKEKGQYDQKDKNDADEVSTLEAQAKELDEDANGLITKRSLFKQVFSAVIAFLSLLFAYSLFRSGVKMKNLRDETQSDRDAVMSNHRIALLGSLTQGLKATIIANFSKLKQELSLLINSLTGNAEKVKSLKARADEILKNN